MVEPVLTEEDHRRWRSLRRAAALAITDPATRARIERAKQRLRWALNHAPKRVEIGWSGGKDSTVLVVLADEVCRQDGRYPVPVVSLKDDLDFPGERQYITDLASRLSIDLEIIEPSFPLLEWIREHADEIAAGADIHGRAFAMSRLGFYRVLDDHHAHRGNQTAVLGLRTEESYPRAINRASHGWHYKRKDGLHIVQPICDWRGLDVYAYLFDRGVDLLPVYRCLRLHAEPWRVRKSWWLPGAAARNGQGVWLRTYYPSLFQRLCEVLPHHRSVT